MEDNELCHFGIKGMKWGRRRYQNEDGSLTDEGRRHYGYRLKRSINNIREARRKKVLAKKRAKALEKARKARVEKKAHEEAKKKAIETGNATEVLKYKNELSTKEKQDIYNRLQADENLAKISDNEIRRKAEEAARNSKWNKAKRFSEKLNDAADMLGKATKAYNVGARVYNAFSDHELPIIGEKKDKKDSVDPTVKRFVDEAMKEYGDMSWKEFSENVDLQTVTTQNQKLSALENIAKKAKSK